jgi:alkanesulfonate monooxygenase SsuD/methylene tetrahydromethanopterin reductase-like flavin-dependent oxidoreductase (luciferase family)
MTGLGILEYFDQSDRSDLAAKRRRSLEAARFADTHGVARVLVAEHHGRTSPSASPILYAAVLASHTSNVRVGTAVSLLRVRNTYLTAVDFAALAAFAGDRVDVGLGRGDFGGPGAHHVGPALRKDDAELDQAFDTLRALLAEGCESLAPTDPMPQFWLHGTGIGSAQCAIDHGMHYSFGLFLRDDVDAAIEAIHHYRERSDGTTALAVSVVANRRPEVAIADAAGVRDVAVNMVGDLDECAEGIRRLIGLTGADEVLLIELSDDTDDHLAAIDFIAKEVA